MLSYEYKNSINILSMGNNFKTIFAEMSIIKLTGSGARADG